MRSSPLLAFASRRSSPGAHRPRSTARAADPAAAQALFDNGKRLMSQRDYGQACAAFQESQRLDPGMGTLFHLADCEERLGRTATAWADFLEVGAEARVKGETTREAAANDRAAALKSRLARLVVDPGAEQGTPGLTVSRDGEPIGQGQWAIEVPIDPASHVILARAAGEGTWRTTVRIRRSGANSLVTVPLLADVPIGRAGGGRASMVTPCRPVDDEGRLDHDDQRRRSQCGAAVGGDTPQRVAGAVVGGAQEWRDSGWGRTSASPRSLNHQSSVSHCAGNVCDATGLSSRNDARTDGDVAAGRFGRGRRGAPRGDHHLRRRAALGGHAFERGEPAEASRRRTRPGWRERERSLVRVRCAYRRYERSCVWAESGAPPSSRVAMPCSTISWLQPGWSLTAPQPRTTHSPSLPISEDAAPTPRLFDAASPGAPDARVDTGTSAPSPFDAGTIPTCGLGEKTCGGACVAVNDSQFGCTPTSCTACALDHATTTCAGSGCAIATCDPGYAECDQNPNDGCETDLSEPDHGGTCNAQCQSRRPLPRPFSVGERLRLLDGMRGRRAHSLRRSVREPEHVSRQLRGVRQRLPCGSQRRDFVHRG